MDYKDRHSIAPQWTYEEFCAYKEPEPYDQFTCANLRELETPDQEVVLLVKQSHIDEPSGLVTFYCIEAPRTCPMRKSFEWGDISWTEYWNHKPWLIEITCQLGGPTVTSRYIVPSEIADKSVKTFEFLGHRGPYILKYEQLKGVFKYSDWITEKSIRSYRDFILRHSERLKSKFPEDFADESPEKVSA